MKITVNPDGTWYHGSNILFSELRAGSTITQWRELAEAFSHQPTMLGYDDDGVITHNGAKKGIFISLMKILRSVKISISIQKQQWI